MIQARIRKHYPAGAGSSAFTLDIDFESAAGVTVLFGPSGAGKTLTLDCIAGFVRPAEGTIRLGETLLFDGATAVNLPPRQRDCGYVFQNYALFPHRTLRQNLEFAAERLPRLERHRRINEMLELFRLGEVAGRRPHELSGGQKQRCSIARALLASPRLILLDEPARGLDLPLRLELYSVLRQVRQDFGTPVLLVTHDLDECFELGEEMVVLSEGRVAQTGPPRRILDSPASLEVASLLGLYVMLPAEVRALDPSRNTSVLRALDRDLAAPYFPGRLIGDQVVLYVRPEQLVAMPRDGRLDDNQVPATLERASERSGSVRLDFTGGLSAVIARRDFERYQQAKDWVVEIPASAIRVL